MKRITLILAMVMMACTAVAQQFVKAPVVTDYHALRTLHKAPASKVEVKDDNGIITSPAEGEEVIFNRTGGGVLLLSGFSTSEGVQDGTSKFVFCDDGTVYWNHPLCDALESQHIELTDTWVKGKLEGETITFAPGQPISCGARPPYTPYVLYMGDFDANDLTAYPVKDEPIVLKFTRGGKVLELQNSSKQHLLGVFSSSTGYSVGSHWDYQTSYTRDTTSEHDPAVTIPFGVSTTQFISNGYDSKVIYDSEVETSYPIGNVSFCSQLGFDGDDAYLSNFSFYGIDHWLKGKRQADGSIVFPKEQYILTTEDHYDLYVYALPHGSMNAADACDLVLTYDAAKGDYVTGQDLFINYEKMGDKLERVERIENFKLISFNDVADAPIYNAPKGYRQISYDCHGQFLASTMGWLNNGQEGTTVDIAYNPNGNDVYLKSPCASVLDPWIKGSIEADGKIHFPTMQYIQKDPDYGSLRTGVFVRKWIYESRYQYTYEWDPSVKEVTFSVDEDGFLYLDPLFEDQKDGEMPPQYVYGFVRGTDEFSCSGYCEAYVIYTPIEGSETITGEGEDPDQPIVDPDEDEKVDISKICPGEQHNELGIITAPGTGNEFTYTRSGGNYTYVAYNTEEGTQSGVIHLVETEDGYIFMQQPLSTYSKAYAATAWIKGVKKDGQYIFPEGQAVNYDAYYDTPLVVCMGEYDSSDGTFVADHKRNIVFDISKDGKTLTLANTSNREPLGLFYEDDDAWVGYGDYNTVLTYKSGGLVEEKVEPSWKAERINYTLTAVDTDPVEGGFKGYNAILAFDANDDVYLTNFCFWADYYNSDTNKYVWIKGKRRSDGSLFFPREQFLYTFEQAGEKFDLFFYGCTEPFEGAYSPSDLVFNYIAAEDKYVAEQDILLTWGRISTSIPRAEQLTNVVLTRDENEGTRPYIIEEQPEGTLYSYSRSGFAFNFINGNIYEADQSGKDIELVFSPDGKTVFMHTPISGAITSNGINTADSWVSGSVDEDGNLTIPLNQWISYDDEMGYGARTGAFVLVENGSTASYFLVPNLVAFTFTLDHSTGCYSLDRVEGIDYDARTPRLIYGAYWSNDYTWTGLGDFDSVYTPNFDYDGIANVTNPGNTETYYDFQGRVARPERGLYIKGGRKMIIR